MRIVWIVILCLCVGFAHAADSGRETGWRTLSASDPNGLIARGRADFDAGKFLTDPVGERELLWWMGHAAVSADDEAALTEAVSRLASLGDARHDPLALAYAGFLRADQLVEAGDVSAVKVALLAAQHLDGSRDPARRALMQFQICDIYTMSGDPDHALPLCREAEAAFQALGDEWNRAQAENDIAANLVNHNEYETALGVYAQARERYRRVGDNSQAVMVGDNMARVLLHLGRPAEALPLSRESHADEIASGRFSDAILSRANIARALNTLGQRRQALAEIAGAVDEARKAGKDGLLPDLLSGQSKLAESAGDLKLALAAEREAVQVQQAHSAPKIRSEEAELGARYAAREKELRIRDLERDNQVKDLKLKTAQAEAARSRETARRSRLTSAITVIVAVGLGIVVLLLGLLLRGQRRHARQLRAQALIDPLTGVENRRGLFQRMEKLLAQAHDPARPPHALMIADLDHFKRVNDTNGHPFGDLVLGGVVDCLRQALHDRGTLARLGGEEFAVLCPCIGVETALRLAEDLRAAVAALRFAQLQHVTTITISIGVAVFDGDRSYNIDSWVRNADAALYTAKAHGRNRVVASAAVK